MNAYFAGNDYHVVDRVDFPKASVVFENVWGVADESLFANVLDRGRREPRARQAVVHARHDDVEPPAVHLSRRPDRHPLARRTRRRRQVHRLGHRQVHRRRAGKPWFDQTLFVIVADHCASVAGKTKLPVGGYRIPLIFYAPKLVAPGEYTPTMSQIDLPPTILDVLRADGDNHFFGRSVFELPATPPRAFVSNYQSLGYLKNGVLTVLSPGRKVEAFRVDPATYESVADADRPESGQRGHRLLSDGIARVPAGRVEGCRARRRRTR